MPNPINIETFDRGVFTAADDENLPPYAMTEMQNLRPFQGKLIKTYGAGEYIATIRTAVGSYTVKNLWNLYHSSLSGDELMLLVYIHDTSGLVKVYKWTGAAWAEITLVTSVYHNQDTNAIMQIGPILRVLPGVTATGLVVANESHGLWYGYIDRDFFDETYSPAAAFYDYKMTLDPPLTSLFTMVLKDNGSYADGDEREYAFSYVYDGNQESLLSAGIKVTFGASQFLEIDFDFNSGTFNKRITAMKVYRRRMDEATYHHIHTIETQRSVWNQPGAGSGAYCLKYFAYIPDCTFTAWSGESGVRLGLDSTGDGSVDTYLVLVKPGSDVTTIIFELDAPPAINELYGVVWSMDDGTPPPTFDSGSTAYVGPALVYTPDLGGSFPAFVDNGWVGGIIRFDTFDAIIAANDQNVFRATVDWDDIGSVAAATNKAIRVCRPINGQYMITTAAPVYSHEFFDNSLPSGFPAPLQDTPSIRVNGRYAKFIGHRLWQADIILDPDDTAEVHEDWVSYSEIDQPDSTPVGNVFAIEESGPCTGIEELYGNPVITKASALVWINAKNPDPAQWVNIEATHQIGNLAPRGLRSAGGRLYTCSSDGIYRISPGNFAAADTTPTEQLRITDAIQDVYQGLSAAQKAAITSVFHPLRQEIVYDFNGAIWAYHIDEGTWREHDSTLDMTMAVNDRSNRALAYDETTTKVRSLDADESVGVSLKTAYFTLSDERAAVIGDLVVSYKSAVALTMTIRKDFDGTITTAAFTLPIHSTMASRRFRIGYRAKRFKVEITGAANTSNTEIGRITILPR